MLDTNYSALRIISENPKNVFINEEALERFAYEASGKELKAPEWREPIFPQQDDQAFVQFIGVVNSINFCFTDFKTGGKYDVEYPEGSGKIWTGAFAMTAAIKRALDDGFPVLDPQFLLKLDEQTLAQIFRHKTIPIPMLKQRLINLNNVGLVLVDKGIDFYDIFCDEGFYIKPPSGDRRVGIVNMLTNYFGCYNWDIGIWEYEGKSYAIRFNKRANLLAMVYHGRAMSSSGRLPPLNDPHNLYPVADYQVPRALRHLKVLRYSRELEDIIDNHLLVTSNSDYEVEIRGQTVNAMMGVVQKINKFRPRDNKVTMIEPDYYVWGFGRKADKPHHYTFTTAY